MKEKDYNGKLIEVAGIACQLSSKYPYHNYRHAIDVLEATSVISTMENCTSYEKFLLKTAALLHDTLFIPGDKENERISVRVAESTLTKIGYNEREVQKIKDLINSTKMPQKPKTHLEKILCDADLDNLGREDFFEKGEGIRKELGVEKNKQWYKNQLNFLKGHKYHTESAQKLRNKGKIRNIAYLQSYLNLIKI